MQSIGAKSKNTSASSVTDMKKQRIHAVLYNATDIKTRGVITVPQIRQFRPVLNNYSLETGSPLGS